MFLSVNILPPFGEFRLRGLASSGRVSLLALLGLTFFLDFSFAILSSAVYLSRLCLIRVFTPAVPTDLLYLVKFSKTFFRGFVN